MQTENQLNSNFVAFSIDGKSKKVLGKTKSVTPTYKGDDYTANEAHYLINGELEAKGEKRHSLKLWINQDVTMEDDVMNKRLISKISVIGGQKALETTLIEYLQNLQSDELVEDDYGNLRYIGANPNNYVQFNNELWRIIGVMKDIENPDGTREDKVKLIRSESIGSYAWDNKASGTGSSTSQYGSNDWSDSALQKVLNEGAYYNRTSGDCPNAQNGATTSCDFSSTGLTEENKSMISESVWNLGGTNSMTNIIPNKSYQIERGVSVYSGHATKWTGKVGLMYPSDYGYATAGGTTKDRNTCLNTNYSNWDLNTVFADCPNNNWLFNSNSKWSITPTNSYASHLNYYLKENGSIAYNVVSDTKNIYPVIYLKSNILIENRSDGTSASPFVLKS